MAKTYCMTTESMTEDFEAPEGGWQLEAITVMRVGETKYMPVDSGTERSEVDLIVCCCWSTGTDE